MFFSGRAVFPQPDSKSPMESNEESMSVIVRFFIYDFPFLIMWGVFRNCSLSIIEGKNFEWLRISAGIFLAICLEEIVL